MPETGGSGLQRIEHIVVLMLENCSSDVQEGMLVVDQAPRDHGHPAGQP